MVIFLRGNKIKIDTNFDGILRETSIRVYERKIKYHVFKYWELIEKFHCLSSPSYINWYKDALTKYYGVSYDTLIRNEEIIKSRKNKIKSLLK